MVKIGCFLSAEEFTPAELVQQAKWADQAGFQAIQISDHFHPWNHEQGQSPFVWSVIGAISQVTDLPIITAVTCPTVRTHPAIIAHAAATSAVMTNEKFILGIGSGEALNEHILGTVWPRTDIRLDMLQESVAVMRKLFRGGVQSHDGQYYTLDHAELYTLPNSPPPIYMSGFGPKAIRLAGFIADGFISTKPSAEDVSLFRSSGGGSKICQGTSKVCWSNDLARARRTTHRLWSTSSLPGELNQVLPTPEHFEQASALVTEDMAAEANLCGNNIDDHIQNIYQYLDAGFDEVFVGQIGPEQEGFFEFYAENILPEIER